MDGALLVAYEDVAEPSVARVVIERVVDRHYRAAGISEYGVRAFSFEAAEKYF